MWPQPTELQILPNWVAFIELSIACPESVGGQGFHRPWPWLSPEAWGKGSFWGN